PVPERPEACSRSGMSRDSRGCPIRRPSAFQFPLADPPCLSLTLPAIPIRVFNRSDFNADTEKRLGTPPQRSFLKSKASLYTCQLKECMARFIRILDRLRTTRYNPCMDRKPLNFFIYCRKSTEDEDRQILSIDAQLSELNAIAQDNDLIIRE